jgi:uncharacterized protein
MEQKNTSLSPLKLSDRIQSLDIMRGIVLLGILLMNINGMALAYAYGNPTVSGGAQGWDLYTYITTNMLFEGTMRSLFSLLFGVGMFILLDRLDKKSAGMEAANIYFRRLTWLLVFGLIHGYLLLWTGEILYNYALMGFLVFSFRKMAPTKLILVSVVLISLGTLWQFSSHEDAKELVENVATAEKYKMEGKELTPELKKATEEWTAMEAKKSPEAVEEYTTNMRKGYFEIVSFLAPQNRHYNENDPYRYDVWDVLSMMLIGIALFKWNILSAEKSFTFYGILALLGYGIGLTINYYETNLILKNNFSFLAYSQSFLTYYIGKTTLAMGHVALIMLFCKAHILKWLKKSLAAVGKMALTNYVMHSVFAIFIFTGVGFGLFGTFQRHELLYIVFAIWIFQLIASPIWLHYFQFGLLEWLWRNLSYQKRHPLRKKRL